MKHRRGKLLAVPAAVILLGLGGFAGHSLGDARPVVASSGNTAAVPASTSYDTLLEHAYTVASPSIVYVDNAGTDTGSGVIYDANGDIVTNAHVIGSATSVRVTLSDGRTLSAKVLGADTADDLAVIKVSATGLPAAHFAGTALPQVAQTVLALGSPLGYQQTVTSGLVSALHRTVQEGNGAYIPDAIQTSAPINPGNSGGALVTLNGTVVGIPTLEANNPQSGSAAQGIAFAIPSTRVVSIANQIIANGKVLHTGRAYIGITLGSGGGNGSFFNPNAGTPNVTGATVTSVGSHSPASQAGLQAGDVITAAGGHPISSPDDLLNILGGEKPGASLALTVNRGGQTLHPTVHLGELPAS